ncbi:MAG: hypothetical protein QOJ81_1915 [Chloroflexota bacterium]|nr:hypothetical protein [Chloroflexota bacterium]
MDRWTPSSSRERQIHPEPVAAAAGRPRHRLARMSIGAAIAVGAVLGLALGIVVSLTTELPLAPEVGLILGGLGGWLSRRDGT